MQRSGSNRRYEHDGDNEKSGQARWNRPSGPRDGNTQNAYGRTQGLNKPRSDTHGSAVKKASQKKQRKNPYATKKTLKSQIQSLKTKLQNDITEKKRKYYQTKLEKLELIEKKILEVQQNRNVDNKSRFKKFAEKKRLLRKKQSLEKSLLSNPSDEALQKAIVDLEKDIEYIDNFPSGHEYVSVLKKDQDPAIREQVEKMRKLGIEMTTKRRKERSITLLRASDPQLDVDSGDEFDGGDTAQKQTPAKAAKGNKPSAKEKENEDDFFMSPANDDEDENDDDDDDDDEDEDEDEDDDDDDDDEEEEEEEDEDDN